VDFGERERERDQVGRPGVNAVGREGRGGISKKSSYSLVLRKASVLLLLHMNAEFAGLDLFAEYKSMQGHFPHFLHTHAGNLLFFDNRYCRELSIGNAVYDYSLEDGLQ
jgi:hypothetical protein